MNSKNPIEKILLFRYNNCVVDKNQGEKTMNNAILSVKRNKNIRMAVLFSAFMFVQFIILRMGNQAGRGFLAEQHQELVYLFIQIVVICGFFSHALI